MVRREGSSTAVSEVKFCSRLRAVRLCGERIYWIKREPRQGETLSEWEKRIGSS